ncbi:MAG: type II toxin-antitoxin system prevent-host-death family antitoxin [Propionibacteriaceae bacterium]|jgi:prevent-host-death family protein|nr:type II toxin-antitoxin system prevent-host-death family antitoxin [Propionibacteriaceae bacterium]
MTVSIYDAKTHLSQLIAQVQETGQGITITRHAKPVAQIIPFPIRRERRILGRLKGQISLSPDWEDFTAADDQDWYGA